MKNQILMDEYIRATRYVFRISKFVILTYKKKYLQTFNVISADFMFQTQFRILVIALAFC